MIKKKFHKSVYNLGSVYNGNSWVFFFLRKLTFIFWYFIKFTQIPSPAKKIFFKHSNKFHHEVWYKGIYSHYYYLAWLFSINVLDAHHFIFIVMQHILFIFLFIEIKEYFNPACLAQVTQHSKNKRSYSFWKGTYFGGKDDSSGIIWHLSPEVCHNCSNLSISFNNYICTPMFVFLIKKTVLIM